MFTSGLSQRGSVVLWSCLALSCSHQAFAQEEAAETGVSQGTKTCASCCKAAQSLAVESPRAGAARKTIRAALDSSTTLEFFQQPLSEIFRFVGDKKGIQIVIDKRALDDLGIATDTPITIDLRDISFRAALVHMLQEFDLTFVVWNETLLITNVDESLEGNFQTVKVYPVADLLRKMDDGMVEYDVLVDTIRTVIEPDSWRVAGGTGDIETIAGTLVVGHTDRVHEKIERLLWILRAVGNPELSPQAPTK